MSDDLYNFDLTEDERPVHADLRNLAGGLPTDDSGFVRILDPVSGAGIFTSNTNPNVSGLDPLTGLVAATGTDTGFGAYLRRMVLSGVENGDFAVPPKNIRAAISDANPLPGWHWVQASGSAITAWWVPDPEVSSGGKIRFDIAEGAADDEAYLEQLVKVAGVLTQRWAVPPVATFQTAGFATSHRVKATSQPLMADLTETGSAGTAIRTFSSLDALTSRSDYFYATNPTLPADAYYMRVRVGVHRGTALDTDIGSVYVSEAAARHYDDLVIIVDSTVPSNLPAIASFSNGQLNVGLNGEATMQLTSAGGMTLGDVAFIKLDVEDDTAAPYVDLRRSDSGGGAIASGDEIGRVKFSGNNNSVPTEGASIVANMDGTPGNGDNPTRLSVWTTPDSSATPAERLRVDQAGRVGINETTLTGQLEVETADAARSALILRTATSQSADALIIENDSGEDTVRITTTTAATQIRAVHGTAAQLRAEGFGASASGQVVLARSRNATFGSHTVLNSGDAIGSVEFRGSDGDQFIQAALILASVDGTASDNDMPTRLTFSTTADAGSAVTERTRIDSTGTLDHKFAVQLTNSITPTQLAANTDNWNPTGLSTCSRILASTDASRNLTGIVAQTNGRLIRLWNIGAQNLVLVHDATSTAANRFYCPGSANLTLTPNSGCWLDYTNDGTNSRWRVMSGI